MRIEGGIGKGELGFVTAQLVCPTFNIDAPVRFFVDTGASRTAVSDRDAIRIGVDYSKLRKEPNGVEAVGGSVDAYLLPRSILLFRFRHSAYAEYLDQLEVLKHGSNVKKDLIQRIPSVLGLDVLRNYSVKVTRDRVTIEK